MPNPDQPQPEDGNAASQPPPANGPGGTSSDGIAEFLDHLTKQHESAAVIFPGTIPPFENKSPPPP